MSHLEKLGNEIHIPLISDENGYIGRECPDTKCEGYFKVMSGTGLTDPEKCHCPYCGQEADAQDFTTKDQIAYAESVIMRQISDAIVEDFKELEFEVKPQGGFGLGISMKVEESPPLPIHRYREKKLETYVECRNCTLKYAVYGVFAFCPDCGEHNSLQVFEKSLEIVAKTLKLSETIEDSDIKRKLIENSLEDCISAFDGFGRGLCNSQENKLKDPNKAKKVSFQNIDGAMKRTKEYLNYDMVAALENAEWDAIIRSFQKRHLISHKMGIIDEEYISKANDLEAILGRKIAVGTDEVLTLSVLLLKLARHMKENIILISVPNI